MKVLSGLLLMFVFGSALAVATSSNSHCVCYSASNPTNANSFIKMINSSMSSQVTIGYYQGVVSICPHSGAHFSAAAFAPWLSEYDLTPTTCHGS